MSKGTYTPQFDVVGPYKLNHTSLYYGQGEKTTPKLLSAMPVKQPIKMLTFHDMMHTVTEW